MRILNSRYFFWVLLSVPAVLMIYGYLSEQLYYGELMHASGEVSGRLLIMTLAITPLRLMFPAQRWPIWLLARRRYLGIATFAYALLHTLFYLQKVGVITDVFEESLAFEYWTGWLALLIFAGLAATSNDRAVKAMKTAWKKLHRWVYAAAILGFLHWIFVAFNFVPGLLHASLLAALQAIRVVKSVMSDRP